MNREKVANKISDVFNPYYTSAPFFLLVAVSASTDAFFTVLNWMVLTVFFSILPLWDIRRRIRLGLVGDAHIGGRKDRIKPFLFSLGCAVTGLAAVYIVGAPIAIKAVAWAVVALGAIITAVTTAWKISLHAAGITSISTVLYFLFGAAALPVALCIPLVMWARLVLRKHTPAQLAAGALAAVAIVTLIFARFGLV